VLYCLITFFNDWPKAGIAESYVIMFINGLYIMIIAVIKLWYYKPFFLGRSLKKKKALAVLALNKVFLGHFRSCFT
jgi:hypothetical protein